MADMLLQWLMIHVVGRRRSWAIRYMATALLMLLAAGLKILLQQDMPGYPYIFAYPMVAVCAVLLRTGLFATGFAALVTVYAVIQPAYSFSASEPGTLPALLAFLTGGLMITGLANLLHRAAEKLADTAERAAALSEQRRDMALEMNHRIKNNLQILAAMLNLQALSGADPKGLKSAADRIAAMGRVHDQLFQLDASSSVVDAKTFITQLCDALQFTLIGDRPITLRSDIAAADITLSQATNIGLLVNEMVVNAVRHAFGEGLSGNIDVTFSVEGETAKLVVADDGRGLTAAPRGFGTRMIDILARQLGGKAHRESGAGTRICVSFPLHAASPDAEPHPQPATAGT